MIFSKAGSDTRRQRSCRTEPPFFVVHGRHTVRICSIGDSPLISSPGIKLSFGGSVGHTIPEIYGGFFEIPKYTPGAVAALRAAKLSDKQTLGDKYKNGSRHRGQLPEYIFDYLFRYSCSSTIQRGRCLPMVRSSPLRYSATFTKPLSLS